MIDFFAMRRRTFFISCGNSIIVFTSSTFVSWRYCYFSSVWRLRALLVSQNCLPLIDILNPYRSFFLWLLGRDYDWRTLSVDICSFWKFSPLIFCQNTFLLIVLNSNYLLLSNTSSLSAYLVTSVKMNESSLSTMERDWFANSS